VGGPVTSCGPAGGNGSGLAVLDGGMGGEGLGCGGGGGGGGAGYIVVRTTGAFDPAGGARISPPVTLNP